MRFLYFSFFSFLSLGLFAQEECAFDFYYFDANLKANAQAKFTTKNVTPPFQHLEIPYQDFTFKSDTPKIFTLPSGTMIEVPAHAFTNAKGKLVKEKITLLYREFNTPTDILLSGIPMSYQTPEGEFPMKSAGMFEIRATTITGEELFTNPAQPISVSVLSTEIENNFNYYEMEDEAGEWDDKGKSVVAEDQIFNFGFAQAPVFEFPHLYIDYVTGRERIRKHDKLQFKTKITLPSRYQKKSELDLYLTEMAAFKNIIWIYDGPENDRNKVKAKLDSINTPQNKISVSYLNDSWVSEESIDPWMMQDMRLSVNPDGDNYLLSFFLKDKIFSVPVYPYLTTRDLKTEQQRNRKAFEKYLSLLAKREPVWQRKKAFYASQKVAFLKSQENVKGGLSDLIDWNIANNQNRSIARRKTQVQSFGFCNIDTILKNLDKEEILVSAEDAQGNALKIKSIYIWDNQYKVLLTYFKNQIKLMQNSKQHSLTILLENNKTAVVTEEEFNAILKNKKGKSVKLIISPIDKEDLSRKQITELTAAL